jgi:protein associated with RNAse G/E
LFKHQWYNLVVSKKNNKYIYYINVASPFLYEDDAFKYIDLDLDFRFYETEKSAFTKLDQDEFEEHSRKFNYPPELINKIKEIEISITNEYRAHKFKKYFDKKLLDSFDI